MYIVNCSKPGSTVAVLGLRRSTEKEALLLASQKEAEGYEVRVTEAATGKEVAR